jgi:hypothetical protein
MFSDFILARSDSALARALTSSLNLLSATQEVKNTAVVQTNTSFTKDELIYFRLV